MTNGPLEVVTLKWFMNLFNHTASCAAPERATNSASIVDKAMHDCFLLLQEMAQLPRKKTKPDVDFLSSPSPAQSASVYPLRVKSFP